MQRITRERLNYQLQLATKLGGFAEGPYPTPGQLVINHSESGYSVDLVVNDGGGQADLSPSGLTTRELYLWLTGFNAGFDAQRKVEYWAGITGKVEA